MCVGLKQKFASSDEVIISNSSMWMAQVGQAFGLSW